MIQTLEELAVKLEEQGKNAVPFQVKRNCWKKAPQEAGWPEQRRLIKKSRG